MLESFAGREVQVAVILLEDSPAFLWWGEAGGEIPCELLSVYYVLLLLLRTLASADSGWHGNRFFSTFVSIRTALQCRIEFKDY